jgi:hypothetical protein
MLTRRQLLQLGAIGGAGVALGRVTLAAAATPPTGVTPKLRRWVEPLPVPPVFDGTGGDARFTIAAGESTTHRFHRDLGPATSWGDGGRAVSRAHDRGAEVGPPDDRVADNLDRSEGEPRPRRVDRSRIAGGVRRRPPAHTRPTWLATSVGGHFEHRNPTVAATELDAK